MESNIVLTQLTGAGLSVGIINALKNSEYFPWIGKDQTKLLRIMAVVTSAITAAGIHYTWNPSARELVFTLPTLGSLWGFGVAWVKSFVVQEVTYQATRKNDGPAGVPNPKPATGQK